MKSVLQICCVLLCIFLVSCSAVKRAERASHKKDKNEVAVVDRRESIEDEEDRNEELKEDRGDEDKVAVKKPVDTGPVFEDINEKYIYDYVAIAQEEMKLYGIPASITLAQGILESSAGKGELTRKSNNHFGIKCNGWQGEKAYHDDDAYQECFRKYKDPKYSFRDHSLFLKERRRYAALFELDIEDYKGWAHGLKKAGYATDPRYPAKLIGLIERYNLSQYDRQVLGNAYTQNQKSGSLKADHTSIRYTVKKGDTLYGIAKQHNLTIEELKMLNNLNSNDLAIGQKLYVKSL
ncbi:glucosaminidase domain-containing protein [Mesonia sp. K7]|uniref:glucosaminidase domain-containing protein n=1 Tax=Mesonia sp. K7 TaxID=2218606 RepID=UPI000DA96BDE|nr:glucosaminidase domain-containing protein [Mesonia sp. K7]PZD78662.1 N-acetylmuramidase [Mesonia sp. K7]